MQPLEMDGAGSAQGVVGCHRFGFWAKLKLKFQL